MPLWGRFFCVPGRCEMQRLSIRACEMQAYPHTPRGCCMALKQLYAAQGEIPDALREHYAEVDGQWLLQTDPSINDIPKLQSALTQERNLRRESEKLHSDLKIRFEGIDPD